ncbi:MAG TPA: hypothetical protein V6C91_20460, partial [Coleofasciculaceae cyanobacterium]
DPTNGSFILGFGNSEARILNSLAERLDFSKKSEKNWSANLHELYQLLYSVRFENLTKTFFTIGTGDYANPIIYRFGSIEKPYTY